MPTAKKATITKITAKKALTPRVKKVVKEEVIPVSDEKMTVTKPSIPFNERMKKPYVFVPVLLVVAGIIAYLLRGTYLAAIVNGQPITRASFDHQLEVKDGKAVLNNMVTQSLIKDEAKRRNISVTGVEMNDATKQITDQLSKQGQTLDAALSARGMTKADFQDQLYVQKLLEKMLKDQTVVSDQEIADYVNKNKDSIPANMSDGDIKATVKQQLQQQKLNDKAQALVLQLQQKAHITYFVSF